MRIYNFDNIIPAGTVMNSNINGQPMQIANMVGFCIQVVFTGTPLGTFSLQASNDQVKQYDIAYTPTNWTTLSNSSDAVSAAGNYMWNIQEPYYNWVRIVYADGSSGSSTAVVTVATFNAKGF